jgi:hypothetical protein
MADNTISLKSLLVPSKEVESEYPGMPGFKVKLTFLSRETLVSIRKKSTKTVFKNRQPVEELDDELFLKLYVAATVKGWSGFKYAYLEKLAPVDVSGKDSETLLEYSEDNALAIMKSSTDFDGFVSEVVSDLGNFSKSSSKV